MGRELASLVSGKRLQTSRLLHLPSRRLMMSLSFKTVSLGGLRLLRSFFQTFMQVMSLILITLGCALLVLVFVLLVAVLQAPNPSSDSSTSQQTCSRMQQDGSSPPLKSMT